MQAKRQPKEETQGVPIILFHQYSFSLYEKSALEFRIRSRGSIAIASIYQINFNILCKNEKYK